MKTPTKPEARHVLLEQLRTAVCVQTSLWDACLDINETFGKECDAVSKAIDVIQDYTRKELQESDLVAMLPGSEELNSSLPIGQGRKTKVLADLNGKVPATFLRACQNALALRNQFRICANKLAESLDCSMESLLDSITSFSITADTGLELDEMDLHAFLGEPVAEGYYARTSGPLKPQVRH
jgi:hypothetical protein